MCSNCPQPKFFTTGEFDASTLTPAECVQIFQCIIDSGSQNQFTEFINEANWSTLNQTQAAALCSVLPGYTVNAGTTADTTDDALGTGTVDCGEVLHFWSSDGSVLFTVADGSAIVDIRVNPAILGTGGAHTVITSIDLQPTGNPNEFTVDLGWTDSNGDPQTTVDGTPITINVPTAEDITCLVPNGPSAPLVSATGTLPDGTTYAVTGGNSSAYGTVQPGDVNWTGEITLTFSQPVNLILSPTASGDPAINNPLTWTYQNGTSPTNPSSTRLVSDGQDLVYTPGAVDAQLAIRTLAVDGVAQANGGLPDSSGLTATQDWGQLTAPAGTVFTLRARQTDAMNIVAQPLAERTVCESLTELYSLVEAAGMVDDPASTELGNLIVEGDDGEEYALPLKSEQCLIETGPSAPVAGVTANNMTGDLDDDDFFEAEFVNTTGADLVINSLVLTTGVWGNPTDVTVSAFFGASTGSVTVTANPGSDVEIVLTPPLVVPANSTFTGSVNASPFGTAKPVTAAAAYAPEQIRHTVRTYSDGETDKTIEFNAAGEPEEITIDPAWTPCGPFDDVETAAIQAIVDAKPDLVTKNVECFANNVGVDQIEGVDNGGIPIADAAMTWTPTASGTGDIILRPDEVGQPPTSTYTIDLEIQADGVVETVLTAAVQGGGFDTVNFGAHSFIAGVVYTLTPSTVTPDVNIFDTLQSTQPAPQVTFVTVPASGSIPVIRIAFAGDERYTVATLTDGTQIACDVDGDEVSVDDRWIACPTSETETEECEIQVERIVLDDSASTVGADYGTGTQVPSINGGNSSNPGPVVIQNYIDANVDYAAPAGTQTGVNPPDDATVGQTDAGWVEFWVNAPVEGVNLSWEWAGEGYARLEVDECGCGTYHIADQRQNTGTAPGTVSTTLTEGLHRVRFTQVDLGGASNSWAYNGDPIETWAGSTPPTVTRKTVLSGCDGTLTNVDGTPVTETLLPGSYPCEPAKPCDTGCCRNSETLQTARTFNQNWPGAINAGVLINPTGAAILLTPGNTVGDTVSAPAEFYNPDGCENVKATLTVERVNATGGGLSFGADGRLSHTANNSDFIVTVEILPDAFGTVHALPFVVNASSVGSNEALVFLADNPVTGYAGGAGGQNISGSLPYTGTWQNNNNNAQSGFSFDPATSLRLQKNGTSTAGATFSISTLEMPTPEPVDACDLIPLIQTEPSAPDLTDAVQLPSFVDATAAAAALPPAGPDGVHLYWNTTTNAIEARP